MTASIIKFEIYYRLKRPAYYFYALIFFLTALLSIAGSAGLFGEGTSSAVTANSPLNIHSYAVFFNKLFLFLIPALAGYSIYRDFSSRTDRFLYSYPLKKTEYLAGKFTAGVSLIVIITLLVLSGLAVGVNLPGVNAEQVTAFDFKVYLKTFFIYLLPNILFASAVVFAVIIRTKNIYAGFISVIILLLLRAAVTSITGSSGLLGIISDPFGENLYELNTKFLTPSEYGTAPIPFDNSILLNRIFWLTAAAAVLTYGYFNFSFLIEKKDQGNSNNIKADVSSFTEAGNTVTEKAEINLAFIPNVKAVWKISQSEFFYIIRSSPFIIMLFAGAIFIAALILKINPQTGINTLPVTGMILGKPFLFYSLLIQFLTFLYSGLLISRSENSGMKELEAVSPLSDGVFYYSKLIALIQMQMLLLMTLMLTGISVQLFSGYYHIDIGNYLFTLFGIHLSGLVIWAVAALFIQTIISNPFAGTFVLILGVIGTDYLPSIGIESILYQFNQNPDKEFFLNYSDITGYGNSLIPYFSYKIYWGIFCVILAWLTTLVNRRLKTNTIRERIYALRSKLHRKHIFAAVMLSLVFVLTGIYLQREELKGMSNKIKENQESEYLKNFKSRFSFYSGIPQPRIVSVFLKLNLYPVENSFTAEGSYALVNKTQETIDTLLIKTGYDVITEIKIPVTAEIIAYDSVLKFWAFKLEKGIEPQDTLILTFEIKNYPATLLHKSSNIFKKASYIRSDILPRLGYFADETQLSPEDTLSHANHYQSMDSDLIDLEIIVSTGKEQTVTAPGKLLEEWSEGDRKYFHFRPEGKIKFGFGINSADYKIYHETHKEKDISIYHHNAHTMCLPKISYGIKSALDYNTKHFGEYRYDNIKIIEFPLSFGTFATAAVNTIQISEIRFINDTSHAGDKYTDISFYTAAHEFTHHWWGNQVMPADAAGALMITESITEYITAKIYEEQYGKRSALNFLSKQFNRYMSGRSEETDKESPLIYVNPQQTYISYGKGAIAFYILSEYMGEVELNSALRSFLKKDGYEGPSYKTSVELIKHIKNEAPSEIHYIIHELFETDDFEKFNSYYQKLINQD